MARVETWGPVPLSADEIERACAIVQESPEVPDGVRFVWAAVAEGTKGAESDVRLAEVLCYHRPTGSSHRVDVDLDAGAVVAHDIRDDVQPSLIYEEYSIAGEVVRADPGWREAMAKRGITDLDLVQVDPWATGNFGLPWEEGRRVVRAMSLWRDTPDDNGYAHPIEGVIAWVDLNERRVVRLEDHGVVPVPTDSGRYDAESNRPWRETLRPLEIIAAGGPELHARRQRDQLGLLAARRDDAPGRRSRAARRRVGGRRRGAIGAEARVAGRDDRAVRRRLARSRLQARDGRRRVRLRPVRELADAGLRLPGRDPLPRRALRAARRRHPHDPQRDLHPRGGLRDPLEAHRPHVRA